MSLPYRPEIDGLRAIAVVAVVLYHADLSALGRPLLPGGFLGVDSFFVISGFLITSIILSERAAGTFSLVGFWERRVRRILPILFTVALATLPLAYALMLPGAMVEHMRALVTSLLFGSNIWFWLEDSYTAEASQLKPLLHTWSLSIEEQFYLLYPPLLLLVSLAGRRVLIAVLAVSGCVSLYMAHQASLAAPDAAFYLLPYRAWQLIAGALLAFAVSTSAIGIARRPAWLPPVALGGLVASFVLFSDDTRHPSLLTVLPVAATAMLIWSTGPRDPVGRVLSSPPVVWMGRRSYGFYLWHFPAFAFARIRLGEPSLAVKLSLVIGSLALAAVTYRMIEQPCRQRSRVAIRPLGAALLAAITVLVTASYVTVQNQGFVHRLPDHLIHMATPEFNRLSAQPAGRDIHGAARSKCLNRTVQTACRFGDPDWILLGDSHADVFATALRDLAADTGHGLIVLTQGICPYMSPDYWLTYAGCPVVNEQRRAYLESLDEPSTIIISAALSGFGLAKHRTEDPLRDGANGRRTGRPADPAAAIASYRENIAGLLSAGHKVVVVHEVPSPDSGSRAGVYLNQRTLISGTPQDNVILMDPGEYEKMTAVDALLALPDHPRLMQIFPREIFCPVSQGRRCIAADANGPIFNTQRHLSRPAVNKVVAAMAPALGVD